MSIVRNENDKLPQDLVDGRAEAYTNMMNIAYLVGLPVSLAIVMFITLIMLGTGFFSSVFLGAVTGVFVLVFAKLFFVH
ncbi:MAG: hypothetical protein HRU11_00515 [Parvularculaceae bacterium]|nr:hypothetical protein [Parvularculaceae bacterium]